MTSAQLALEGGEPVRKGLLPYARHSLTPEDRQAVMRVLEGPWLTGGPSAEAFEICLASAVDASWAVACSSGTAALHMAYLAAGVGAGDEIITSPLTFLATANAALYAQAKPVFVDVRPDTLNIDPEQVEGHITPQTKAIVAVHYGGLPCLMPMLRKICDKHGLKLIEDACHALGATTSGLADLSVWSFHPAKHVAAGEGGCVTGYVTAYRDALRQLRNHGIPAPGDRRDWRYEAETLGYNYRMSDIQAALALSQLKRLPENIKRRRQIADTYFRAFRGLESLRLPPQDFPGSENAWHLYPVRLKLDRLATDRETIYHALKAEGIGTNVHYLPVYLHPLYQRMGYKRGLCPVAEGAYEELLSLPMFHGMGQQDVEDVVNAVHKVIGRYRH